MLVFWKGFGDVTHTHSEVSRGSKLAVGPETTKASNRSPDLNMVNILPETFR